MTRRRTTSAAATTAASLLLLLLLLASTPSANAEDRAVQASNADIDQRADAAPPSLITLTSDSIFDALDTDRDGVVSRADFDESLGRVVDALGVVESDGSAGGGGEGGGGGLGKLVPARGLGGGKDHGGLLTEEGGDDGLIQGGGGGGEGGGGGAAAADPPNRNRRDGLTGDVNPDGRSFHPGRSSQNSQQKNAKAPPKKLSFTKAFTSSVAMILACEIGDKTFFIAAVLSMRNDRAVVFVGSLLALIVMTILSTMMGLVLPSVLPRRYTHVIGGLLFLYFGIKLVLDSRTMEDNKVSDELEEVEEELGVQSGTSKKEESEDDSDDYDGLTSGTDTDIENSTAVGITKRKSSNHRHSPAKRSSSGLSSATAYQSNSTQKVFLQALTLTFLAEWGDRSQIATIALAAAKDPLGVTIGGCLGHSICTGMAVVGGRMLASRISERTVTFWGGVVFNIFGVHSLFFES